MYHCDLCDKSYTRKANLNSHKLSVHEGVKFSCVQCGKVYSSKSYLNIHLKRFHHSPTEKQFLPAVPTSSSQSSDQLSTDADSIIKETIKKHQSAITQYKIKRDRSVIVNFNLLKNPLDKRSLLKILRYHKFSFKINASPGFVLKNKFSNETKYFYASFGTKDTLLPYPVIITSKADFEDFVDMILSLDTADLLRKRMPSSQWKAKTLTNLSFYTFIIHGHALRSDSH